ncbi:response regulator transcription factor [Luteimonas sp. 3794]|uniref:response regulator transcription factor n=1 Tax=Luteimonas sp. 3794 TaxID=2817730 RepID=UPI0028571B44|nr:response regulator transcription factor [Luteimonas sp. 3794]MDR6990133.1 DNA-binding response OmpR family regulator [Luteimonas sp. 3794]
MTAHAPLHVAVLEDEVMLRERILLPGLQRFGFDVVGFETIAALRAHLELRPVDLVVLDVGLPDGDGFSLARALRETRPQLGVVMLTSRAETGDRVRGLAEGADAYLTKPVEIDLLAATLHSLARRIGTTPAPARAPDRRWRMSEDGWCLLSPSGGSAALTQSERRLCRRLFETPGALVSREQLIETLTEQVHDFDAHRIDSMIHRLRSKAHARCGEDLPLTAVRGRGYMLTPQG